MLVITSIPTVTGISEAIAEGGKDKELAEARIKKFNVDVFCDANTGTQVYLKNYIEGAVDFIFGQTGSAFFQGNTIASKAPGCITASGRSTDDATMCKTCFFPSGLIGSCFLTPLVLLVVFNKNTLTQASDTTSTLTGNVYLGRPWRGKSLQLFHGIF